MIRRERKPRSKMPLQNSREGKKVSSHREAEPNMRGRVELMEEHIVLGTAHGRNITCRKCG